MYHAPDFLVSSASEYWATKFYTKTKLNFFLSRESWFSLRVRKWLVYNVYNNTAFVAHIRRITAKPKMRCKGTLFF